MSDYIPFTLEKFEQHLRYQLSVCNGDILAKSIEDIMGRFYNDLPGEIYDELACSLRVYYESKKFAHQIASDTVQKMRDEIAEGKA